MQIIHPIPPLWRAESKTLILGSFPSVKSRESGFFYGHPQNRFWRVCASVFSASVPETIEEKKQFILEHNLALWDVIASCDIQGSADSSIRDALPNDIGVILNGADIQNIFVNGKTAEKLYNQYLFPKYKISAVCLPSTSPANAAWSLERLIDAWRPIAKIEN